MVDNEVAHLSRADSTMDVMCVHGSGASISVLMDAGVRSADLVIAVTGVDDTNMVCCLIAKSLGARHTVARVRNTEYRQDADILKREIGQDMVINPDLAAAQEIARILSFPAAISVEPFAGGRIDMIGLQALPEDTLVGHSLSSFHGERRAAAPSMTAGLMPSPVKAAIPAAAQAVTRMSLYVRSSYLSP